MTPTCNLVCIHTCFKTECFTLLWHRLWVLAGHSLIIRDVQRKSIYIKYIGCQLWWYGCQSWECIQALLELLKAGMGTILDPEYLHAYHSLYLYVYNIYIYVYIYIYIYIYTQKYINWKSNVPMVTKTGSIKTLIFRAYDCKWHSNKYCRQDLSEIHSP